jgi:predicted MFS family arabinose efflux permease
MPDFSLLFWASLVLCAAVTFRSSDFYKKRNQKATNKRSSSDQDSLSEEIKLIHAKLLNKYLFVYLMAALSDWLQGPYVYALYSEYGFKQHHIAQLFVAGFGSSMIFGSFVGSIADWGGRRFFVIIFAIVYAASCMTKRKCIVLCRDSFGIHKRGFSTDTSTIFLD